MKNDFKIDGKFTYFSPIPEMKPKLTIYSGGKCIRLHNGKPEESPDEWSLEVNSKRMVKNALEEFERSKGKQTLVLWSEDKRKDPETIFLSLFRFVEAAGGVIRNEKGDCLFIYRYGKWDLPKGKISKSDRVGSQGTQNNDVNGENTSTEALCALREVKEETGLKKVQITRKLFPTYHIYREKKTRILKRTTWFEMFAAASQPLHPQEKESISEVRWIPVPKVLSVVDQSYPSLRDLIRCVL